MSDFSVLTDAQLNERAALAMGWHRGSYPKESPWWLNEKGEIASYFYNPSESISHAANLGDAFLAAFPSVSFQVTKHSASVFRAYLFTELGPAWRADDPSEARTRTVALLTAWEALRAK